MMRLVQVCNQIVSSAKAEWRGISSDCRWSAWMVALWLPGTIASLTSWVCEMVGNDLSGGQKWSLES